MEKLQQSSRSLEADAEVLRSQLHAVGQERAGQAQEVTNLQRTLREAETKVRHHLRSQLNLHKHSGKNKRVQCAGQMEELDSDIRTITRERDNLRQALVQQEAQASGTLQEETHKLRAENQELQHKVVNSPRACVKLIL